MNKKQLILAEAKKLFGSYGYLGFTLKQLASACDMTSPALYYFYSSKAELFKDCFLSELVIREEVVQHCIEHSVTFPEFASSMVLGMIDVCEQSSFRTSQALRETVHLPDDVQTAIRAAWNEKIIMPVEAFLQTTLPNPPSQLSYRLLAAYCINMATFSAVHIREYSREELAALFYAVANGLVTTSEPASV